MEAAMAEAMAGALDDPERTRQALNQRSRSRGEQTSQERPDHEAFARESCGNVHGDGASGRDANAKVFIPRSCSARFCEQSAPIAASASTQHCSSARAVSCSTVREEH
eukprot:6197282-Pleurochrysis_carterae.AAC.1